MKKRLKIKKFVVLTIAVLTIVISSSIVSIQSARAADSAVGNIVTGGLAVAKLATGQSDYNPLTTITGVIAIFAWATMSVAGWFLSLAGTLLNVGMYLTTHLDAFINQTPVIYTVWSIIRDLSSTLLIFFILWASIQMILGIKRANFGELVKNIIIVGILINFSFFFARAFIDLSNIVSLQFYNAIAPTNSAQTSVQATTNAGTPTVSIVAPWLLTSGGISDIIMGSLHINNFLSSYTTKPQDIFVKNAVSANINIIILELAGIFVVTITIINFLILALVCVARIAILIFLLGFSPIWIASMAIPQLKPLSEKWMGQFKAQLIFLPVYLAFLYVALRIITASQLGNMVTAQSSNTGAGMWSNLINLSVGFSIIIVLLNIPFIAAVQASGYSVGFIDKAYKGMMSKVNGWAKSSTIGAAGWGARKTIGAGAASLDKSLSNTRFFGATVLGRDIRSGTIGAIAKSKFGTSRSTEDYNKEVKEAKRKGVEIDRRASFSTLLDEANKGIPPKLDATSGKPITVGTALGRMSEKEKLALKVDHLKDPNVLEHLKNKDFEAIKKADETDISNEDKAEIFAARKASFKSALADPHQATRVKNMTKAYSGDDLADLDPADLNNDNLVLTMTTKQVKDFSDSTTDVAKKSAIKTAVTRLSGTTTPATIEGWVLDQSHRGIWP